MKLFRQKDELFELMARSSSKGPGDAGAAAAPGAGAGSGSGAGAGAGAGAAADGTSSGSRRTAKSTPTTRPLPRPTGSLGTPRITTTKGVRPLGQPSDANSFASPLGGPPIQRPIGELLEIEGDALVVLDDDWEAAAPPSEPGRLLALRLDTAVVGGLLVVGLLATAFLVGRTSSDEQAKLPTIAQAPLDASMPAASLTAPLPASAAASGGTTAPAGFRPGANATATAGATAPVAPTTPAAAERSAAKGKFEIVVVATRPEKAAALVKWLNENARSPIFGRTDLEASVDGRTVKLVGFAQKEAEVLTRVKATSDPTGGSGTFHDAFWRSVR